MNLTEAQCRDMVEQASNLKLVCIFNWGRSGSMFLGSLLDNHPNLLTIRHTDRINNFFAGTWNEIQKWLGTHPLKNNSDLADFLLPKFPQKLAEYPGFRQGLMSVLDQVNHLTARVLFCLMHLVYEHCLDRDLSTKTMINYQLHSPINTPEIRALLEVFPDAIFLGIHRDPVRNMASWFKLFLQNTRESKGNQNLAYHHLMYFTEDYNHWLRYLFLGWTPLPRWFNIHIHEIRLESIHSHPKETLEEIVKILDVPWSGTLLESTFAGEAFTQNSFSNKDPNSGFQKKSEPPADTRDFLNAIDLFVFRGLMKDYSNRRGYGPIGNVHYLAALLLSTLPTKLEIKAFLSALRSFKPALLIRAAATWSKRLTMIARITLGFNISGYDLFGKDLTLMGLPHIKANRPVVAKAWTILRKLEKRGAVGLAPANDLTHMLVNRYHQKGLKPPPVFDLNPKKPFNTKICSYEAAQGIDAVLICSPSFKNQIKQSLKSQGVPAQNLIAVDLEKCRVSQIIKSMV